MNIKRIIKWIAIGFGALVVLFTIVGVTGEKGTKITEQTISPSAQSKKEISYEILERWAIPNGGEGKVIVISPDYLNETDMVVLGGKLKNDTKNDRNAFISVFTDKKAAALRSKGMAGELSKADQDLFDKSYVGQYNKNGNTGYHAFAIYLDGVMGSNQKIIQY